MFSGWDLVRRDRDQLAASYIGDAGVERNTKGRDCCQTSPMLFRYEGKGGFGFVLSLRSARQTDRLADVRYLLWVVVQWCTPVGTVEVRYVRK